MRRVMSSVVFATALIAFGTAFAEEEKLVAKVNDVGISQAEFDRTWNSFLQQSGIPVSHSDKAGDPKMLELRKRVMNGLVDQELLFQEATNKKFTVPKEKVAAEIDAVQKRFPDVKAYQEALKQNNMTEEKFKAYLTRNLTIQGLVEEEIGKGLTVMDTEVHEFYDANKAKFETPEMVRARHILVMIDPKADDATKEKARAKAEGLLKEIKSGADFIEVAKKNSDDTSAGKGGDLGFFPRGQMVGPFEQAAFGLKPGEVSGVVQTQFGFHIIKLEEHKDAGKVSEQEVANEIRNHLKQQKMSTAVETRLKTLREKAKVVFTNN